MTKHTRIVLATITVLMLAISFLAWPAINRVSAQELTPKQERAKNKMRVKIFRYDFRQGFESREECDVRFSSELESRINTWLAQNPYVKILEIKTWSDAKVEDRIYVFIQYEPMPN